MLKKLCFSLLLSLNFIAYSGMDKDGNCLIDTMDNCCRIIRRCEQYKACPACSLATCCLCAHCCYVTANEWSIKLNEEVVKARCTNPASYKPSYPWIVQRSVDSGNPCRILYRLELEKKQNLNKMN